jgi:chaperone modulatory protein CbpM
MPKRAPSNEPDKYSGELIEEGPELTLEQLCRRCGMEAEKITALVEHGLIEPVGGAKTEWHFSSVSIMRVKKACRLQRDLGVNTAGAALALELLDEIEALRNRLDRLENEVVE